MNRSELLEDVLALLRDLDKARESDRIFPPQVVARSCWRPS